MKKPLFLQQEHRDNIAFCKKCLRKVSNQKHPRWRAIFNATLLGCEINEIAFRILQMDEVKL